MHRSLTSTGALAVTAMIDLALLSRSAPVALVVIGERQKISMSYLEQLFGKLRRQGLVRPTRGPRGGYSLGRDADQISVADIVNAVDKPGDGPARGRKAVGRDGSAGLRLTDDLWAGLNAKLIEWLDAITLKALVDARPAERAPKRPASIALAFSLRPVVEPIKITAPNSVFAFASAISKQGHPGHPYPSRPE